MIAFVRGTVQSVTASAAVLDVSGIGVELLITARCRAGLPVGALATVPASMVVREDGWLLFGFADNDERTCFQALQLAKGIGPKVAINLLGALTPDQLRRAVATGDAAALTAAPGIGQKGAARLIIDLRDRLGPPAGDEPSLPAPAQQASGWRREVQLALVGLGWTGGDASAAIARIEHHAQPGGDACGADGRPSTAALLRLALRSLDHTAEAT